MVSLDLHYDRFHVVNLYEAERTEENVLMAAAILSKVIEQYEIGYYTKNTLDSVFWAALNDTYCISYWLSEDEFFGDCISMKLEEIASDGSMGPHCEQVCDERYETKDLSFESIQETLLEIADTANLEDSGLSDFTIEKAKEVAKSIQETYKLACAIQEVFNRKPSLDEQILESKKKQVSIPDLSVQSKNIEMKQEL